MYKKKYRVQKTASPPGEFTVPGIVRVCAADEELVGLCLGEDPDVVVAVVLALPLHQAQLSVPLTRVPRDPLL